MKKIPMLKCVTLSPPSLLSGSIQKKLCSQSGANVGSEAKTFAERRRKKIIFSIVAAFFFASNPGCKKEIATSFNNAKDKGLQVRPPNITIYPIVKCIYSYSQLISELGTNTVRVRSVILHDGTLINRGNEILHIAYTAINVQEPYSLFRSELKVVYNLYGYQQENTTNCWSLGCVYQDAGVPPFTSIWKDRSVLLINTTFVWNLPGGNGRVVKHLIVD